MNKDLEMLKKVVGYLALAFLIYSFLVHGIAAIKQTPGFISMIMSLGFTFNFSKFLLYVVGAVDLGIAYALYFYRNDVVLTYGSLWPIIPGLITFFLVGTLLLTDLLLAPISGILVYYFLGFNYKGYLIKKKLQPSRLKKPS